MDKKEAIKYLKERLEEIPHLAGLPYKNQEYSLWCNQISDVLEEVFGHDSTEYKRFSEAFMRVSIPGEGQRLYQEELELRHTAVLSIIKKYETLGIEEKPTAYAEPQPKAFIAHGGESPALDKLKNYLIALGIEPLVVEEQPSRGRSIGENVDWYARQADFAIILATRGDKDTKTGGFIPRGNVLIEIGKAQELFPDRIIYLLQAGTKFPSNISEKIWVRFVPQSMDDSFIRIAKEIREFGILKAVKPQKEHSS